MEFNFRHRMHIEKSEKNLQEICVMVYEIEDNMVVLSKEGKYAYIQNDLAYQLK